MPSRRNFLLGIGSVLSGGSTFLGSSAFSLDPDSRTKNYVPVETATLSAGQQFSIGTTPAPDEEPDDTGREPDTGDDGDDQSDDGNDGDQPDEPDDEQTVDRSTDDGGGGSAGTTSIRLQASGPDVLNSPHVRTDGAGRLTGVVLERVNKRARTYLGETSYGRYPDPPAGDRVAFLVINDGTVPVQLGVDVSGTATEVFGLPAFVPSGTGQGHQVDLMEDVVRRLDPGGTIYAVVEIDTTGVGTVPDDAVERITVVAVPR